MVSVIVGPDAGHSTLHAERCDSKDAVKKLTVKIIAVKKIAT
jgi:hypothetical protein